MDRDLSRDLFMDSIQSRDHKRDIKWNPDP